MRQLFNSTYVTLDGVIEGPHLWPALKGGTSDEGEAIQTELLQKCDIVLMGRRTYDVFAPAWSSRSGDPYSDRINTMRKVVVSTTLTDPDWNNTEVIASDVVDRVRDLKAQDGGHIVQYGFGDVSRLLLEHGLFDQLHLWIHPQLVGPSDDNDLLYRPGSAAAFDLVDSRVLSNGIVVATYAP
ncbi:MAG TPA: dihydrofolate reductase family protein [Ilumatobacteraceae bacterium]|nr:dihydrofolate reductase family protein [Ilumatobacteraceae bacterium]